jgi:hypothetical protein
MPTIFDRLGTALSGNTLSANLTVEAGNLSGIVSTVAGLISDPPDDFQGFLQDLAELPLPDLNVAGGLATNLGNIQNALPTDLGDVSGSFLTALGELGDSVGLGITNVLAEALEVAQAIEHLLHTDLTCGLVGSLSFGGSADGGPGPGGDVPPGPGTFDALPTGDDPGPGNGAGSGDGASSNLPAPETLDQALALLDGLPAPLNAESLLKWLHSLTNIPRPEGFLLRAVPLLDDLRDPLDTLITWEAMTPAEILGHLAATLQAAEAFIRQGLDAVLGSLLAELATLAAQFQPGADTLAQAADELTARLGELRTAVQGADPSSGSGQDLSGTGPAVTALNAQLDALDAVRATFEAEVQAPLLALTARLETLPADLDDQMNHIISVLQPGGALGRLTRGEALPDLSLPPAAEAAFTELEQKLGDYLGFFTNLLDKIDMQALQAPITAIADEARAAADGLDQALVAITLQVQGLFSQVEGLLDQVDTTALVDQAQAAIDGFKDQVIQQLTTAFAPVRTAIEAVVTQIDQAVGQFDPASLVAELQAAIDSIAGVLTDPEVTALLDKIRTALDSVAQAIESLAFTPVTDEVVATIDQLTAAVSSIDTSLLTAPLQMALKAAVSVLPQDLAPVTDPLVDQFGQLIDAGPVPLIETVRDQPARLLDQVRSFDPGALVGDALSQPFQSLLGQMEGFQPSSLLGSVDSELDGFKDRLRQNASPGQLVAPLVPLHQQLMQSVDALQPSGLLQPLEDGVEQVINGILDTLPADEFFDQFDAVAHTIEDVVALGDRLVAVVQRVRDLLGDLNDGPGQLQTWVGAILDKIGGLADTSSLNPHFAALSATVDSSRAAGLTATFSASADPLLAALDTLNPAGRLATLIQVYYTFPRPALEALPDSPEKTAILAALDRFNPSQPAFNAAYQALADLRTALLAAQANLATATADWDARYHPADGILASLQKTGATGAELRGWIEDALGDTLVTPLSALFAGFDPLQRMVAAIATALETTITALQTKVSSILLGPNSLTGIRDALDQLVQRLRDLNLSFLTDSLDDLFGNVRGKLEALNPAALQQTLDTAFEQMLDSLSLDLAIPPASLAQLDADYADILDKLRLLDPQKVVTEVITPVYEEKVVPLIEAFDLTPVLTTIVDKLRSLDDELRGEMDRVNTGYQAFLAAVPDVSISIDVSLPF